MLRRQSMRDIFTRINYLERQNNERNRGWSTYDKYVRELYERVAKLENQDKYNSDKLDIRLKILEDSYTILARTLDANGIREACMHCGQKLPKEKDFF